jgi:hypothetical protein
MQLTWKVWSTSHHWITCHMAPAASKQNVTAARTIPQPLLTPPLVLPLHLLPPPSSPHSCSHCSHCPSQVVLGPAHHAALGPDCAGRGGAGRQQQPGGALHRTAVPAAPGEPQGQEEGEGGGGGVRGGQGAAGQVAAGLSAIALTLPCLAWGNKCVGRRDQGRGAQEDLARPSRVWLDQDDSTHSCGCSHSPNR